MTRKLERNYPCPVRVGSELFLGPLHQPLFHGSSSVCHRVRPEGHVSRVCALIRRRTQAETSGVSVVPVAVDSLLMPARCICISEIYSTGSILIHFLCAKQSTTHKRDNNFLALSLSLQQPQNPAQYFVHAASSYSTELWSIDHRICNSVQFGNFIVYTVDSSEPTHWRTRKMNCTT